jgi:hypothetical protein
MIAVSTLNLFMDHLYTCCYVDNMLIAAKSKIDITNLKAQLSSEFEMKDLGAAKKIITALLLHGIPRQFNLISAPSLT